MSDPVTLMLLLPLLGAVLCWLVPASLARPVALLVSVATLTQALRVTAGLPADGPLRVPLGGWEAPAGIELSITGFGLLMVAVSALVTAALVVFAMREPGLPVRAWTSLTLLALAAMGTLYTSGDLFNIYVGLELLGVAAVGLVATGSDRRTLRAGIRYLTGAFAGSLAYLMGVAILYRTSGSLALHQVDGSGHAEAAALALITVGLMLKAGAFPVHFWLPVAHAASPASVSPLLSGLVTKASIFVLLRAWVEAVPGAATPAAATLVGILGCAAILWGSLQALLSPHIKPIIAYSTVAQLGYLLVGVPLIVVAAAGYEAATLAWTGLAIYCAAHAIAKSALFLSAGVIVHAMGSTRIDGLAGAAGRMPMATTAWLLATIALIGLPPSLGFVGKWYLLLAALEAGQWWWLLPIAGGGLLTAAVLVRAARRFFTPAPEDMVVERRHLREAPALVLALVAVVTGFVAIPIIELTTAGAPFTAELEP